CRGVEGARGVGGVAGEPGEDGAVFAAQADADVAVEQAVAVAVFGDEQEAAVEVGAGFAEHGFDAGVEGAGALGAVAHGGEQTQAGGEREGFGGVVGVGQRAPVGEQVVAMGLQGVGEGFVEVDAGEVAASQECEGGGGVAFADCGGQGGEVEGGVLAPGFGVVGAAGCEGCWPGLHRCGVRGGGGGGGGLVAAGWWWGGGGGRGGWRPGAVGGGLGGGGGVGGWGGGLDSRLRGNDELVVRGNDGLVVRGDGALIQAPGWR